jgi:hypothetical protein
MGRHPRRRADDQEIRSECLADLAVDWDGPGQLRCVLGSANLLVTSSSPQAFNATTGKWVADSKGLREVVNFYKTASAEGLLAPPSEILDPNGPGIVGPFLPKHQIGITFGGNSMFPKSGTQPIVNLAELTVRRRLVSRQSRRPTVRRRASGLRSQVGVS